MIKTSELQSKEVININTGQRLGMVMDVDVDLAVGKIKGLLVPKKGGMFSFLKSGDELYISWDDIHRIGEDVILVNLKGFNGGNSQDIILE